MMRYILVTMLLVTGCGSSTTEPASSAEAHEAAGAQAETAVAHGGGEGMHKHGAVPSVCEEISKACHDVGHGPGDAGTCHVIGHKGDAAACEKEHHRCLALCEELAKKTPVSPEGAGHSSH